MRQFLKVFVCTTTLFITTATIVNFAAPVKAEDILKVTKKSELNLDTSMIVEDQNFGQPTKIVLAPIFIRADLKITAQEWYRGLFYYFSSERFNYKDIPVHMVIDKDGNLFEGIAGGLERKIAIKGIGDNAILVVYLANLADSDFSENSKGNLQNLLLSLANENGIKPANISITGLKLEIDQEKKIVELSSEEIFGSWKLTFGKISEYLNNNYKPTAKKYQISVAGIENLPNAVKMGSEVVLKLKLKNIGQHTLYSGTDGDLLLSKADGKDSRFFVNNLWVSKSQMPVIPDGASLRPNQEESYDLKFKIPLYPGKMKEDFVLKTAAGYELPDSKVSVEFNIDKGGANLLEIIKVDANYTNIRRTPNINAESIGKGSPGERYVWLERNDSNWYKISYEGNEGWVFGKYVKVL